MDGQFWVGLAALLLTGLVGIAVVVFQAGELKQEVRGVNKRLDILNGTVQKDHTRIGILEGIWEWVEKNK